MLTYQEFKDSLTEQERGIVECYDGILKQMVCDLNRPASSFKILEIGSGWGIFSRVMLERGCQHTTIDKVRSGYGRPEFIKNTAGFEGKFEQIDADSQKFLPTKLEDWKGKFDLIMVDADHGQEGAGKDITNAWGMLAPDGIMLIDDVFHKSNWDVQPQMSGGFNFGVARALWGFLLDHKNEIDPFDGIRVHVVGHGLIEIRKA